MRCVLQPGHSTCSVGRCKREMAEMCVNAVLAVADLERRDVNLDLIKACPTHSHACLRQQPRFPLPHPASWFPHIRFSPLSKASPDTCAEMAILRWQY